MVHESIPDYSYVGKYAFLCRATNLVYEAIFEGFVCSPELRNNIGLNASKNLEDEMRKCLVVYLGLINNKIPEDKRKEGPVHDLIDKINNLLKFTK